MEGRSNEAVQRRYKNLDNFSGPPGSVIVREIDRMLGLPTLCAQGPLSPPKAEALDVGWTSELCGEFYKIPMPKFDSKMLTSLVCL